MLLGGCRRTCSAVLVYVQPRAGLFIEVVGPHSSKIEFERKPLPPLQKKPDPVVEFWKATAVCRIYQFDPRVNRKDYHKYLTCTALFRCSEDVGWGIFLGLSATGCHSVPLPWANVVPTLWEADVHFPRKQPSRKRAWLFLFYEVRLAFWVYQVEDDPRLFSTYKKANFYYTRYDETAVKELLFPYTWFKNERYNRLSYWRIRYVPID